MSSRNRRWSLLGRAALAIIAGASWIFWCSEPSRSFIHIQFESTADDAFIESDSAGPQGVKVPCDLSFETRGDTQIQVVARAGMLKTTGTLYVASEAKLSPVPFLGNSQSRDGGAWVMDEYPSRRDRVLIVFPSEADAVLHFMLSGLIDDMLWLEVDDTVVNRASAPSKRAHRPVGHVRLSPREHLLRGNGWEASLRLPAQASLFLVVTSYTGSTSSTASFGFDPDRFLKDEFIVDDRHVAPSSDGSCSMVGERFQATARRAGDDEELRIDVRTADKAWIFGFTVTSHPPK